MAAMDEQITASVRTAFENRTALDICGAGTKSFLGRRDGNADKLDIAAHSGIVEYDPAELVLVARAGTPLLEIERLLREHGQMLGFEPPYVTAGATLGGAVAAGLAGPRRFFAGAVRDFLLGATFVNGKGEVVNAGGKVMKNVAGFDLFRPMARSMGTLGVLLQVALRLIPLPESEQTLLHEETDEAAALRKMNQWPSRTQAISAACWDGAAIRIRLSGSTAGIRHAAGLIGGELADDTGYWRELNDHELDFFNSRGRLWRVCLAPMSASPGLDGRQLLDWGGAQRWLKSGQPAAEIRSLAAALGGFAECYGDEPGTPTFHPLDGALLAANRRFKAALDPAGILNPGRLYPEL